MKAGESSNCVYSETHAAPSKGRIGDQTAARGAETRGDALFGRRTAVTQEVVTAKEC